MHLFSFTLDGQTIRNATGTRAVTLGADTYTPAAIELASSIVSSVDLTVDPVTVRVALDHPVALVVATGRTPAVTVTVRLRDGSRIYTGRVVEARRGVTSVDLLCQTPLARLEAPRHPWLWSALDNLGPGSPGWFHVDPWVARFGSPCTVTHVSSSLRTVTVSGLDAVGVTLATEWPSFAQAWFGNGIARAHT